MSQKRNIRVTGCVNDVCLKPANQKRAFTTVWPRQHIICILWLPQFQEWFLYRKKKKKKGSDSSLCWSDWGTSTSDKALAPETLKKLLGGAVKRPRSHSQVPHRAQSQKNPSKHKSAWSGKRLRSKQCLCAALCALLVGQITAHVFYEGWWEGWGSRLLYRTKGESSFTLGSGGGGLFGLRAQWMATHPWQTLLQKPFPSVSLKNISRNNVV